MIELTARLKAVAEYVRQGVVLADIGTDHAYIPVYLKQHGMIKSAYACDINQGPLANAGKVIESENVSEIKLVHADGLSGITPGSADDIIVAGMGGELIASILEKTKWIKNERYNLILQPMTRADYLRRFLYAEGFAIKSEILAEERDKIYTVINAGYCGIKKQLSDKDALLGKERNGSAFIKKANAEIRKLQKKADGLRISDGNESEFKHTELLLSEIKEIVNAIS